MQHEATFLTNFFANNSFIRYDVYTTIEPGIFESMALVHSRVGRVIFGANNKEEGGLGGTGNNISVHCLPGTNHRYRAFRCYENEDKDIHYFLRTTCEK